MNRCRAAVVALLVAAISACSDAGPTDNVGGTLRISVEGLPEGTPAAVTVSGPGAYSETLSGSDELVQLAAGTYRIAAEGVTAAGATFAPLAPLQEIEVNDGPVSATVTYADVASGLEVNVEGLPSGVQAEVEVTGPSGFSTTLQNGRLIPALVPGRYQVVAKGVVVGDSSYQAHPISAAVEVTADAPATIDVRYRAVAQREVNFRIEALYLVQSIQTRNGSVPLVAERDAYVRVFAVANQPNSATPFVRVRLFENETEVATLMMPARSDSVVQAVDQGSAVTSWNVAVPGELIRPGLRVLADVDPENGVKEADELDNRFPASGTPQELTVEVLPPLRLRLVPIHQSSTGRTGNITAQNLDRHLALTRKLHPIGELDVEIRSVYTTSVAPLDPDGHAWETLLSELEAIRVAEAGDPFYYYGVVNPPYTGGGVIGMANGIPSRTSLGWDRLPAASETLAHELGHNFGRYHSPCGPAGGADPDYPYTLGLIGSYGMDTETGEIKSPFAFSDIMGYCEPSPWISDYTFQHVLAYRSEADEVATESTSLLIWGRAGEDELVLEPAFRVRTRPVLPTGGGPYRLEGFDASGARLFSYGFSGSVVADGRGGGRTFAFAIPESAVPLERLATLRLSDGRRVATMHSGSEARAGEPGPVPPFLHADARRTGGEVELRWDAQAHPLAVVRDPISGTILALARGGEARLRSEAARLDVVFSDGVRSSATAIGVQRTMP